MKVNNKRHIMEFEDFDFDEFDGQEQDDWLMDINGVREEFDPETKELLKHF
jgi:hypothetical protein|tara:strand:- start:413 stop:565 length:153 start_codon:yes stop_codon:yes gene_type:complete